LFLERNLLEYGRTNHFRWWIGIGAHLFEELLELGVRPKLRERVPVRVLTNRDNVSGLGAENLPAHDQGPSCSFHYSENAPLDLRAEAPNAIVVEGVATLEQLTTMSPPVEGLVLRYGQIYGPGTGRDEPARPAPLHVDAAAHAALLAIDRGKPGIFNIAEDDGFVSIAKALRELGFDPGFRN
jgi:hypothetical protein